MAVLRDKSAAARSSAPPSIIGRVDAHLTKIFELEIAQQCRFVTLGADQLAEAVAAQYEGRGEAHHTWAALQTILVSAANVSKLLWGTRDKYEARRRDLRARLGVGDTSCLRSRDLRNDFEHFDERLEQYFGGGGKHYIGRSLGRFNVVVEGGKPPPPFGNYDPETGLVAFWDRSASVPEIVAEASRIHRQAITAALGFYRDDLPL